MSYLLTAITCYLGIVGGFILHHFAKSEIKKVKNDFWFIKKSYVIYAALATIFYFARNLEFFDSVASAIFIYGVAVGALDSKNKLKTVARNSVFLIVSLVLMLFNF